MELLSPAGTPAQLLAAVEAGADAVYLGGKAFSARKFAGNFSDEEMADAVRLCHTAGVAVYVTLNTLLHDGEWAALADYLRFLEKLSIDGLLVQDLGVARAAREISPAIPLHASTQMTVSNLDGVRFLESLGFTRAVLSRELSLPEISAIAQSTAMEIEVFVQGALCVCYSGQCLMSSFIGGRSGNRGACAQPCRMPYTLTDAAGRSVRSERGNYLLSLKDMTGLDRLAELEKSGVLSLKVEGRMKSPAYVYAVISAYRRALDALAAGGCDTAPLFRNMQSHFNRGYTHGYFDGKISGDMLSGFAPGNHGVPCGRAETFGRGFFTFTPTHREERVTGVSFVAGGEMKFVPADKLRLGKSVRVPTEKLPEKGAEIYWTVEETPVTVAVKNMMRKIPVCADFLARAGEPLRLTLSDGERSVTAVSEILAERAEKRVTTEEEIRAQLSRLGNTLFTLEHAVIENDGCMVPKSVLNHLRQEAAERLADAREKDFISAHRPAPAHREIRFPARLSQNQTPALVLRTDSARQALDGMEAGISRVIFGGEGWSHKKIPKADYEKVLERARELGVHVTFASPRVVREKDREKTQAEFHALAGMRPDTMEISFPGAFLWTEDLPVGVALTAGPSFNIFNREALRFAEERGVSEAMLSPELTLSEIRSIARTAEIPLGAAVYGRQEMMISEYCPMNALLAGGADKTRCPAPCTKNRYALRDKGGRLFPLRTDEYCHLHVLNSATLDMRPHMKKLAEAGLSRFVIDLRGTEENAAALIASFRRALEGNPEEGLTKDVTRGHYFRGAE